MSNARAEPNGRSRGRWLIAGVIVGGLIGVVVAFTQPVLYSATATLSTTQASHVPGYLNLIRTDEVAVRADHALAGDVVKLNPSIRVARVINSGDIQIVAEANSPSEAIKASTALATAAAEVINEVNPSDGVVAHTAQTADVARGIEARVVVIAAITLFGMLGATLIASVRPRTRRDA